jgi:putative membrane protein
MLTLLASASDWHHHWFWPIFPLLWLLLILVFVRLFFWGPWRGRGSSSGRPDAREILAERYARGEINHEEYRERLGHLDER